MTPCNANAGTAVREGKMKKKGIREIEWGVSAGDGGSCIYDNGHIPAEQFLSAVKEADHLDTPKDVREAYTVDDVEHLRFRPMSPTEARNWGCDYGVMECDGQRGYPVTAIRTK